MRRVCMSSLLEHIAERAPSKSLLATGAAWSVPVLAELFEPGAGRAILSSRRRRTSILDEPHQSSLSMSTPVVRAAADDGLDRRQDDHLDPEVEVEPSNTPIESQVDPETEIPPVQQPVEVDGTRVEQVLSLMIPAREVEEIAAARLPQLRVVNVARTRPQHPARRVPRYMEIELNSRFLAQRSHSIARIKQLRDASRAPRFR